MDSISDNFTIDVRRLWILEELRNRGTVTAVADALHLTPSAVSQQIARISRDLGDVPLVVRHGRRVRLTAQANLLLKHAAVMRRQIERARADLHAHDPGHTGNVTIGGSASVIRGLIAPAVGRLARERPRLNVAVREIEPPDAFTQLECGELDLTILAAHRGEPSGADPRFERIDLLVDPLVTALPVGHPAAASRAVDLSVLADDAWIISADEGPCSDAGFAACTTAGFSPVVRHRVNDWAAALAIVAAGAGVVLVPHIATAPPPLGVLLRPLASPSAGRVLYAALRGGSLRMPSYKSVLDVLGTRARELEEEHRQITDHFRADDAADTGVSQPR